MAERSDSLVVLRTARAARFVMHWIGRGPDLALSKEFEAWNAAIDAAAGIAHFYLLQWQGPFAESRRHQQRTSSAKPVATFLPSAGKLCHHLRCG